MPIEEDRENQEVENKETTLRKEIKNQIDSELKQKLNNYYNQLIRQLNSETNIANRYEMKIELESISKMYNLLFN